MFLLCQYSRGSLIEAYQIYVTAGANGYIGQKSELTLNMKNKTEIATWECTLVLPDGVTFLRADISGERYPEGYKAELTTTTNDDGSITIKCEGAGTVAMTDTDGEVATVTVHIANTVNPGDYIVTVINTELVSSDETSHYRDNGPEMTWTILQIPEPSGQWKFNNPSDLMAATVGNVTLSPVVLGSASVSPATVSEAGITAAEGANGSAGIFVPAASALKVTRAEGAVASTNFSFMIDLKVSDAYAFDGLFQTSTDNSNDGEFFIYNNKIGTSAMGGYFDSILDNVWYRVVFTNSNGSAKVYLNGEKIIDYETSNLRWEIDSVFYLLADDDGEKADTYVSEVAFWETPLTDEEAIALGNSGDENPVEGNTLYINNFSVSAGETVDVPICLHNTEPIVGIQMKFTSEYEGITFSSDVEEYTMCTDRLDYEAACLAAKENPEHVEDLFEFERLKNGTIMFRCKEIGYTDNDGYHNVSFIGNDGPLFKIPLTIANTVKNGTYTIEFTQTLVSAVTDPNESPKTIQTSPTGSFILTVGTNEPIAQTLTLTASGNGAITYGDISVRSSSQSFDVAELSEVVLTVTPDAGYHVETLTVNGEDALSQLTDGKLTIGSMTASVTVAVTFANDPGNAQYEAALKAYPNGTYYITTEVNGIKYYVNAQGELAERTKYDEVSDGLFTINQVSGGVLYDIGWHIEGADGHFTNTTLTDNKANLHPGTGKFRLDGSNNRNDWESQVFFLNADGKIAIRSCNTAYGENSWADAGRAFWTYEIGEAGEVVYGDNGNLIPCYTYEPAYIWTLETIDIQTLTLTASGNGAITYGDTSVRSSSQSFDVAELSEVVLTVTPDAGHHVETLTINGEDALSQLTSDGKLSIGSMTASVTVAVTFAANVIDFADANVKALCVANWDTNGDGELDEAEAAAVTGLGKVFSENQTITSFNELQYFTGLTSIGELAFGGCSSLTSITIPDGVTSIGLDAFKDCYRLISISIPKSVTSIGDEAFEDCCGLTSITIPNCVTIIGNSAFFRCYRLTSITIPESVTSIGANAFQGCYGLTSITIPESVTSIGICAFVYCHGLTTIKVDEGNTVYDSRENCNAIIETKSNTLVAGCLNTVIPNSVTSIGNYAFDGCSVLTSITIPNSVTSIGDYAFGQCDDLKSITIPESVTSIGHRAFHYCTGLTSITILGSVISIGNEVFRYCSGLTEAYCYAEQVPNTGSNAFFDTNIEDATLYVPKGSVELYKATSPWSDFGTIVEIPSEANPDINSDGSVDVADIMAIINLIADDIYLASADLNNDKFVDVGDIVGVINVMMGNYSYSAGVKAISTLTDTEPVTENNDYLTIANEDNIASIQLDNEFEYSAFQMLVTLPDGVDINAVTFNSDRLNGFTKFVKKVNERQYIIIGFSMDGNVIAGSTGKMLSLSTTGKADDDIIISDPIFSIPEAKPYKLRVADSYTTNLHGIQREEISVRGNTLYVYANSDTTLNIYSVSGALCEQKHLHPGVNTITLRRGQYIINNQKITIFK